VISYLDTSLLVKLYVEENDSQMARDMVARTDIEASISWLSDVEMAAALQARPIRSTGGPTKAQLDRAYGLFLRERAGGIYTVLAMDRTVFDLARSLAERYSGTLGVRALDVLHVAAAVRGGAEAFATFDDRQRQLARELGLQILQ
jgi:predicted nucleic acid-binding protein